MLHVYLLISGTLGSCCSCSQCICKFLFDVKVTKCYVDTFSSLDDNWYVVFLLIFFYVLNNAVLKFQYTFNMLIINDQFACQSMLVILSVPSHPSQPSRFKFQYLKSDVNVRHFFKIQINITVRKKSIIKLKLYSFQFLNQEQIRNNTQFTVFTLSF